MSRSLDYEQDPELSELLERLRVALESAPALPADVEEAVEGVMREVMVRNRQRRVLQRMQAQGWMDGRPEQARLELEALDAGLRERLPALLARLEQLRAPQAP
jgi:hypothetical protein